MSTTAVDAQRLLDSDGPHLRKWMNDDPNDFIATVHRVAAAAAALRAAFAPPTASEPTAQPYAPGETPYPRTPGSRFPRK